MGWLGRSGPSPWLSPVWLEPVHPYYGLEGLTSSSCAILSSLVNALVRCYANALQQGSYSRRYTILHTRRGTIENVKSDKLYPYTPWSDALPSTAPKLDALCEQRHRIGTRCKSGSLFIIPVSHPWPFAVGKLLRTNTNGVIGMYGLRGIALNAMPRYLARAKQPSKGMTDS